METLLTAKTRKVQYNMRFGGREESGNGVLKTEDSTNFYCDDGTVKTACITPMLLDNGKTASYTFSNPMALHRIKRYNETEKTYSNHYYAMTESGTVHGQFSALENSYSLMARDMGMGELTVFMDRNLRAWAGAFGDPNCVIIDDEMKVTKLAIEKPSAAGCYFKHRLFVAVKPSTLLYSAVDDLTNFTDSLEEGGAISFPMGGGEIVAIRPFKDTLYLFFERGIMRMKIGALPKEFSAEKVEYRGGKIFGRTVCVGENAILFMTEEGLYRLDERGAKEVCHGLVLMPYGETKAEGAAVWKGKAFIRYQVSSGVYKTLTIHEDGTGCMYLDDMPALSQEDGGMAVFRGKMYTIFRLCEEGSVLNGQASLKSAYTDFGTSKRKLLTKIRLKGRGCFYLTMWNGKRKTRKYVYMEDGQAELRFYERGVDFAFGIEADSFTEIKEMTVEMRVGA